jgi:uncharacterized protein (DUF1697 family)
VKYVAFLRAINVGGRVVKMDRLRCLFEELRFSEVETFIASGNVIFTAASRNTKALEGRIGSHLEKRLGHAVPAFLRTPAELAEVARQRPFGKVELSPKGAAMYVGFLKQAPGAARKQRVMELSSDANAFHVRGREVYWLCRERSTESLTSMARLEKALGMPVTFRNETTVNKIAARHA